MYVYTHLGFYNYVVVILSCCYIIYIYMYVYTHSEGLVFKGFPPHFKGLEESLILDRFSLKKIKAVC